MYQDMKNLTQAILGSFEARTAGIGQIRQEASDQRHAARNQIQDLHSAHEAMAKTLREELTQGYAQLATGVESQREEARSAVRALDHAHEAMAKSLREDLGQVRGELAQAHARQKAGVGALIQAFASDHASARQEWGSMIAQLRRKRSNGATPSPAMPAAEKSEPKKRQPSRKRSGK